MVTKWSPTFRLVARGFSQPIAKPSFLLVLWEVGRSREEDIQRLIHYPICENEAVWQSTWEVFIAQCLRLMQALEDTVRAIQSERDLTLNKLVPHSHAAFEMIDGQSRD